MKYQKNYLANVIFQLRFDPILALEDNSPSGFQEKITEFFPRMTEGQEFEIQTTMSPNKTVDAKVKTLRKRWTFLTGDDSKCVTISANMFCLEYKKYEDIIEARKDFDFLWQEFQNIYTVPALNRVGLRYVNQITLQSGDPLNWEGYIDDEVINATFKSPSLANHNLARSIHHIHLVGEDHQVKFQFGVPNSDFPNPIAKREFILDYDCYSIGETSPSDAGNCLVSYGTLMEELFEKSIGEELRNDMEIIEDTRIG